MPYMCVVPGCRGNYRKGPKVSIFKFPNEDELKRKWISSIRRKDFNFTGSRVCELHFKEEDIVRRVYVMKDGEEIPCPLDKIRLRKGAVPSIFPVCATNVSKQHPTSEQPGEKRIQLQPDEKENEQTKEAEDKRLEQWCFNILMKEEVVKSRQYLCSDHFELKAFTNTLKRRLLPEAIPTIQTPGMHKETRDYRTAQKEIMKEHKEAMAVQSAEDSEEMEVDVISVEPSSDDETPVMNGSISEISSVKSEPLIQDSPDHSTDITNFITSCKALARDKYKESLDKLMLDISSSLKNISRLMLQAEQASRTVDQFLINNRPIFKASLSLPSNLKTLKSSVHDSSKSILNSNNRKEAATSDGLEILNTVSGGPKINLPPAGELTRSELDINSRVWAMKTNLLNVWVKGTITSFKINGSEKLYRVRLDNQKHMGHKPFAAKHLAYENTATVIVPVGTRIIARYTDSAGRSAHYAGIVAEPPKITNNKRYLIFFDDGCAQYVKHEDIYVVCAQSVDVADDVHENISDFVRGYLIQYPERPMVKLQKDQFVKTEYNFEWSDARVLEVDCSMVKMLFLSSERTEWIYRGSTRLKPLRNELANAEAHRLEGKNRRRHNIPRRPHQPYIEYTREDVVVLDSDSDEEKSNSTSAGEVKTVKPRNTARKSLGTRPFTTLNVRNNPVYHVTDKKSHLGYKDLSRIKAFMRTPFRNHDCGIHCREKDPPVKHKGKNPLLIPILLGWERQLRKFRASGPGPKQIVIYRSVCGRHLRNLEDIQNYLYLVKSELTIDLFSVDPNLNLFRSFRPKEVFYKDEDITQGKENIPVSCVNSLADEPPPYVEYSAERFPGEGVFLNLSPDYLCGCDCTDECKNPATCACQQITNHVKYGTKVGDAGYKFRRLREPLVTGIYECNSRCKCSSQCGNRVVQNGLTVRLQMFKTQYKGWGIRCLDDIDAGQFICIYAGQLLTEQGADADGKECGDEYLAELDHIEVVEKTKEGYESDVPELKMDVDVYKTVKKEEEDEDEENVSSDDNYVSSDSDVLFDSDSEFESSDLRSTAISTYATRSRQKNGKKGSKSPDSGSNVIFDDSNSVPECDNKDAKDLPDLSNNLETFKINPRPPSPESAQALEKIELKRKPKVSENADMDTSPDSPVYIKESDEPDEKKPKCESATESQNSAENSIDAKCQRVVAKKSVSMKNPLSSLEIDNRDSKFKSVRSFFGEDNGMYIMDAKSKGNIGRYLNHSCEPNVFVQNVFVDTHDLRFPSVAFFAHDTIDAGTELTWDYNYEVGSVTDKVMYCYCEAASCRGRLL